MDAHGSTCTHCCCTDVLTEVLLRYAGAYRRLGSISSSALRRHAYQVLEGPFPHTCNATSKSKRAVAVAAKELIDHRFQCFAWRLSIGGVKMRREFEPDLVCLVQRRVSCAAAAQLGLRCSLHHSHKPLADGKTIMAGPVAHSTAKGKGKGKAQDDSAGSVSKPSADTTPRPDREEPSLGASSGVGGAMAAKAVQVAKLCCSEPVELPRRKTLCLLAMVVAVLAVMRSVLLPVSSCSPVEHKNQRSLTAAAPVHAEEVPSAA